MHYKRKPFLCKLGLHLVDKEHSRVRRSIHVKKQIIAYHAFCKRCNKKLYRVDRYGIKKET